MIIGFSLIGARMLHYYSTRMVNDLWLHQDGKHVDIAFMSAWGIPKTEKMRILNFGYMQESRLLNVDVATYQQLRSVYINVDRNAFHHPEHNEIIKRLMSGQELTLQNATNMEADVKFGKPIKSGNVAQEMTE